MSGLRRSHHAQPRTKFPIIPLHRADAFDADLRILGLAVPQPPAQALDLLDDHRLCGRALRTIARQASGNLRQVLQPHGDVEPVEYRKPRDARVEKNAPQPETAVSKRRQRCALGPPDRIEAAADQACEIRVGLRHGAEGLPSSARRLDIADPDLEVPLAGLAAADKVESKLTTIASASTLTGTSAADVIDRVLATL